MKKVIIFLLVLSIFGLQASTMNFGPFPPWLDTNKIINQTDYPVLVIAQFEDYPSPENGNIGILIEPQSNSKYINTRFFDAPILITEGTSAFNIIGIQGANQPYIKPSKQLNNPLQKDYQVKIENGQFILE